MTDDWTSWERRESGPPDAEHRVLLLPGGMCSAMSYNEVMSQPSLAGVGLVAVTLPGHADAAAPSDFSVEHYARLVGGLAADVGCDVVVGFSMGANVALEMVASRDFTGPVILLAPCFSRADEAVFIRALDRLTPVFGHLPYRAMLAFIGRAVPSSPLPKQRREELVAVLRRNDPKVLRRAIHEYLDYLDRHGSVASRLGDAAVPAWVVHNQDGDGGITDAERLTLAEFQQITVTTIPGQGFFLPNEEPGLVAETILTALQHG